MRTTKTVTPKRQERIELAKKMHAEQKMTTDAIALKLGCDKRLIEMDLAYDPNNPEPLLEDKRDKELAENMVAIMADKRERTFDDILNGANTKNDGRGNLTKNKLQYSEDEVRRMALHLLSTSHMQTVGTKGGIYRIAEAKK